MKFEKAPNLGRMLTQDDWKRTQIRMPQNLYAALSIYAGEQQISLNSAMIDLMDKGLTARDPSTQAVSNAEVVEPTLKAAYFTQKLYGFIHMANRLESRISNTEYVLKHTKDPKEQERYTILLDICQHDLGQLRKDMETALNTLKKENANIGQELALEIDTILKKSTA